MEIPKGIHTGTSGWNYDAWKGDFYSEKIGGTRMLEEYGQRFGTVEGNGTFYSLPDPATVEDWCGRVPDDFVFSVKASRYITHMKMPQLTQKRARRVRLLRQRREGPRTEGRPTATAMHP